MIADTLIVMIFCISSKVQEPVEVTSGKEDFKELFNEADKKFDKVHKIDLEALKRASQEAAEEAAEKTKKMRDKAYGNAVP